MKTVLFASWTLKEKQRFMTVKIHSIHLYASIHLHISMQGTMSEQLRERKLIARVTRVSSYICWGRGMFCKLFYLFQSLAPRYNTDWRTLQIVLSVIFAGKMT